MLEALLWGIPVAGALVLGTALAAFIKLPQEVPAAVTALGGGILLAAVGLEVVPEAEKLTDAWLVVVGLLVGALVFVAADWALTREERRRDFRRSMHAAAAGRLEEGQGGTARGLSIALGIFIDGVPETAALGLTIAQGEIGLALLAGIVVSNLTESYGASAFMIGGGRSKWFALAIFGGIAVALLLALVVGSSVLSATSDHVAGFAQALAAGAVIATVSISILPNAFLEVSRFAALATVVGFVLGYLLR